jgi:DNA polymerase-3 subunit delta'
MLNAVDGLPDILISRIIAQALLCQEYQGKPCGTCNSCQMVEKNNHPDLLFSFPYISSGKSSTCEEHLDKWMPFIEKNPAFLSSEWVDVLDGGNKQLKIFTAESERINKFLSLKSYLGNKKVIILYLSELLHNSTANKLLKSIEEPLENTHLILITHQAENTLPTITSRCQIVNIPILSENSIIQDIEALGLDTDTEVIKLSRGNIGLYHYILENKEELQKSGNDFMQWLRDCFKSNTKSLLSYSEELSKFGREHLLTVVESYLLYFRDAFINPIPNNLNPTVLLSMEKLSNFVNERNAHVIYEQLHHLISDLKRNANPKIALFDTSIKISGLLKL